MVNLRPLLLNVNAGNNSTNKVINLMLLYKQNLTPKKAPSPSPLPMNGFLFRLQRNLFWVWWLSTCAMAQLKSFNHGDKIGDTLHKHCFMELAFVSMNVLVSASRYATVKIPIHITVCITINVLPLVSTHMGCFKHRNCKTNYFR